MAPKWRTQTAQLQGACAYLAVLKAGTVDAFLRTHTLIYARDSKGSKSNLRIRKEKIILDIKRI